VAPERRRSDVEHAVDETARELASLETGDIYTDCDIEQSAESRAESLTVKLAELLRPYLEAVGAGGGERFKRRNFACPPP
jgi:hypothetical protein